LSSIKAGRVPEAWQWAYPSSKPISLWISDLAARVDQVARWAATGSLLPSFWLGGLAQPEAFLAAVLQTAAHRSGISLDRLSFEVTPISVAERDIVQAPSEGVFVHGLFLEGAGWDFDAGCLCEPTPLALFTPMPVLHLRPAESRRHSARGTYACPVYRYPDRGGTSHVIYVNLKSGETDSEHLILRSAALLMSTSF
jgi:dynein heavy chain